MAERRSDGANMRITGATVSTEERIKGAIISHQKWKLNRPDGKRANLSFEDMANWQLAGVDLSMIDFTGAFMAGANLTKANLQGCNFFMADLEGADLTGANLVGSNLRGARLTRCNLTNARLDGADLSKGQITLEFVKKSERLEALGSAPRATGVYSTDLSSSTMQRSVLVNANLTDCDMTGADLSGADAKGADLSGSILLDANLKDLHIDDARFDGAVTFGAHMDESLRGQLKARGASESQFGRKVDLPALLALHQTWLETEGAEGGPLNVECADLSGAILSKRDLSSARLRRCQLANADFTESTLVFADLTMSDLAGAKFDRADLGGCSLRRANLRGASFVEASLFPARLGGEAARNWPTSLENAAMHGANFAGAKMQLPILRGARITGDMLETMRTIGVPVGVLRKMIVEAAGS